MSYQREEQRNLFYKHKKHLTKSKKCDIIRMYEMAALFFGALRVTPPEKLRNLQAGAALVIHFKKCQNTILRKKLTIPARCGDTSEALAAAEKQRVL